MHIEYIKIHLSNLSMKKLLPYFLLLTFSLIILQSCTDDIDDKSVPVQDFTWKGLNLYYLWQENVPSLADNRFADQRELNIYLSRYNDASELFNNLLYQKGVVDRFSVIYSDYTLLENALQGTSKNNGVDYGLVYKNGSSTNIFGWVKYVLPNSNASDKDIKRGDIFYAVNGIPLTTSNYNSLLQTDNYTLNLADYNNGMITPNGKSVTLTKTDFSENPVLINQSYTINNHKIGYLVYNGFYGNYDETLNNAFGQFAADGITDLVLDLRYNSGGLITSATRLASMITGQFEGQLFAKQQWNSKAENYFNKTNPEVLINRFTNLLQNGTTINSLHLNKVYILTSSGTASASELVINGLKPYINVIQIGDVTIGKNVGSITIYDSPTFGPNNRNTSHKYAMQPLVLKTVNKNGFGDYQDGLIPTIQLRENLGNLSQLGNTDEPLLNTAITQITGTGKKTNTNPSSIHFKTFKDARTIDRHIQDEMYLDEIPNGMLNMIHPLK